MRRLPRRTESRAELAVLGGNAEMCCGGRTQGGGELARRVRHRLARHHGAGGPEGARVVADHIGIERLTGRDLSRLDDRIDLDLRAALMAAGA